MVVPEFSRLSAAVTDEWLKKWVNDSAPRQWNPELLAVEEKEQRCSVAQMVSNNDNIIASSTSSAAELYGLSSTFSHLKALIKY